MPLSNELSACVRKLLYPPSGTDLLALINVLKSPQYIDEIVKYCKNDK